MVNLADEIKENFALAVIQKSKSNLQALIIL